jgi:hypothetical protein
MRCFVKCAGVEGGVLSGSAATQQLQALVDQASNQNCLPEDHNQEAAKVQTHATKDMTACRANTGNANDNKHTLYKHI